MVLISNVVLISGAVTVGAGGVDISNVSASSVASVSSEPAAVELDAVSDVSVRTLSATTKSAVFVCTASTVVDVEEAQLGAGYKTEKEPWHSS